MILALADEICLASLFNVKDAARHDAFMHRRPLTRRRLREDVTDRAEYIKAFYNNAYLDEYARVRRKYNWSPYP